MRYLQYHKSIFNSNNTILFSYFSSDKNLLSPLNINNRTEKKSKEEQPVARGGIHQSKPHRSFEI